MARERKAPPLRTPPRADKRQRVTEHDLLQLYAVYVAEAETAQSRMVNVTGYTAATAGGVGAAAAVAAMNQSNWSSESLMRWLVPVVLIAAWAAVGQIASGF